MNTALFDLRTKNVKYYALLLSLDYLSLRMKTVFFNIVFLLKNASGIQFLIIKCVIDFSDIHRVPYVFSRTYGRPNYFLFIFLTTCSTLQAMSRTCVLHVNQNSVVGEIRIPIIYN